MRRLHVDDITADEQATTRELVAAYRMRQLLDRFEAPEAIVLALTHFRGKDRIIRWKDAHVFAQLCAEHEDDIETAWLLALASDLFLHMDRPLLPELALDLNAMSDFDCRKKFRFSHDGIKRLIILMRIPSVIIVPGHRDRISAVEGVCLLLDRMVYPKRWQDLASVYQRHTPALSRIFTYMLHRILGAVKDRIMFSQTITRERLDEYSEAFWRQGVPRTARIWSTIDVKKVPNCRPTTGQRAQYSGHTKVHCFKYQTLEAPDGSTCLFTKGEKLLFTFALRGGSFLTTQEVTPLLSHLIQIITNGDLPHR